MVFKHKNCVLHTAKTLHTVDKHFTFTPEATPAKHSSPTTNNQLFHFLHLILSSYEFGKQTQVVNGLPILCKYYYSTIL